MNVPADEFLEWVRLEATRRGTSEMALCETAAPRVGLEAGSIARWINRIRHSGHADLARVDAFITALDGALTDLPSQAADQDGFVEGWCPRCRDTVMAAPTGECSWCDTQTGAGTGTPNGKNRNAGVPILMTDAVLLEARDLYATGKSMREVAELLIDRTGYKTPRSFTSALFNHFKRRGWTTRTQADATAARNYKHGLGGRDRDESAYRKMMRASRSHQCEGTLVRSGQRCPRRAITGEAYCPVHHPERAADNARRLAKVRAQWAENAEPCGGTVENRERKGQPCLRRAVPGTGYCPAHQHQAHQAAA